jgi:hypothetical protein
MSIDGMFDDLRDVILEGIEDAPEPDGSDDAEGFLAFNLDDLRKYRESISGFVEGAIEKFKNDAIRDRYLREE